jgi:hypothetical protein
VAEQTPFERIQLANERMSITEACAYIGMGDVSGLVKTYCPFGELMHEDGGRGKAFRVYPETNSAYCFACGRPYRPVSLIATDRDLTEHEAASLILEEVGYIPPDLDSMWAAASNDTPVIDHNSLIAALKTACARIDPNWEERQLEPMVARVFSRCLAPLEKVTTEEEARQWLDVTKKAMHTVLTHVKEPTT